MKNLIVITASMLVASSLVSATPGAPVTDAPQQPNTQSMLPGGCIRKQPTLKQRIKASWKHFGLAAATLYLPKALWLGVGTTYGYDFGYERDNENGVFLGFRKGLPAIKLAFRYPERGPSLNICNISYPYFLQNNIAYYWYLVSAFQVYQGIQAFINPNSALSSQQTTTTPAVAQPAA